MPDNCPEQMRKKLYEEYEDSLFKLAMYDAAEKEGRLFLEENENLKNDPESAPSEASLQKFSRQLDAELKKPRIYARRRRIRQALNKAAIAMLIVLVIFGSTVMTVQAVRVRVLNLLINIQQEYTSFEFQDNDNNGKENGSATLDWHGVYAPTYIPAGYEVSASSGNGHLKEIEFKNPQGSLITYMELGEGSKPALDTENAPVFEPVDINGHQGTVVVKHSLVTVIWAMNDRMFIIRGQTDQDTVIRMARGVKYLD